MPLRKAMVPKSPGPKNKDHLWKPGESGNPAGRPPKVRNRLCGAFLNDMLEAWQASGAQAIQTFIDERPHEFVKLVAGIMPKEFEIKISEVEDLSDEQLDIQLTAVLVQLEAAGIDLGPGKEAADGPEEPGALPPLS